MQSEFAAVKTTDANTGKSNSNQQEDLVTENLQGTVPINLSGYILILTHIYNYMNIIILKLHLSVCPSVTGRCRPLPEIELTLRPILSLTAAWRLPVERYGKRLLSAVGRHDGKLRTCMEGE